jgi:predicted phage tail protein
MLKLFSLRFSKIKKALLALIIFVLLIFDLNCGKRKPPLPPLERVSQRVEIDGFQRGNLVNLSWIMPARNAADASNLNINRIDVYRLTETLNTPLTLSEEEFSSRSTLIASLPVSNDDFGLKKFTFTDTLEFAGQTARLRYAIRFVNSSGQKAAFSNFLLVEPTAKVAEAPNSLAAKTAEEAIILNWAAPLSNVDGSKPVNLLGFNIYRSASEKETAKILNTTPVSEPEFSDKFFEFNQKYFYFIRAISLGSNGEPVESLESNIVNIIPQDIFPPKAPSAITIAAAPNNLAVFFAANLEKDIAGYKIYRSTSRELPFLQWQNLTQELLTTNTFQDTNVESGKTYYYYLVAVDKTGNISQPSEIFSETAP